MKKRVQELVEAATVLSGAGDRDGALRLVDEALRLAPDDATARAFRQQLSPSPAAPAGTPFAPPPAGLFGGAPRPSANPFVRPDAELGAASLQGAAQGNDLEKLLLDATGSLQLPTTPTDPAGVPSPPSQSTALFGGQGAPPASSTLFYAQPPQRPPTSGSPNSTTLQYAQRPDPPRPPTGGAGPTSTVPFGTKPARPGSDSGTSRSGTLVAGEATSSTTAPVESPKRPPSSPGSARTGTMLSGGRGSRPKTGGKARPPSKAPASTPMMGRAASSAPYDPMELIDAPAPLAPAEKKAVDVLKGARQLLEFADHSGALALVEQVLAESPNNAEALALKARCEATLTSMFESKLGDLSRRPRLRLRPDEVIWLNLDHRAGFVLAQIDGQLSLEDIFDLSGMGRLDTAKILAQLVEEKVIQV
jgi:hypothetical protein